MRIFQLEIELDEEFVCKLPEGAQFLSCTTQLNVPQMWFLVDPSAPLVARTFLARDTFTVVGDDEPYRGTFQINGDTVAYHLFERL